MESRATAARWLQGRVDAGSVPPSTVPSLARDRRRCLLELQRLGRLPRVSDALWYFAYGSNMSRAIFVERRGIQPVAAIWGWLRDYRLCFDLPVGPGERGVANVVPEAGARTCGVAYRITPKQAEHLDHTEGVGGGFYRRIGIVVAGAHGDAIGAFTYHSTFGSPGRKPSPRYIGLLLDGAREHGLPPEYIDFLRAFDLAADERSERGR